jgi:fluoroquinolone resistance protein
MVTFTECKLTGANVSGAVSLGVTFKETLLVGAFLLGFFFLKCELDNLDFSDADLREVVFRHSVFKGGSLSNFRVNGARI